MRRVLISILVIALLAYAAACAALFLFQRSLLYFPQPAQVATPLVPIEGRAGVVASHRAVAGPQAVLYFGGNAEDVSASLPLLDSAFPEHALYLMHYRGYAGSSGKPTERALVADALALFDRVRAEHGDVVVIGRSLGSGVAVQVASLRQAGKLVLITPFASLQELAGRQFPYFPVRWLLRDRYDSGKHAPRVRAPTLIVAAGQDEIIPAASTQLLLSRFTDGVATMKVINGVGHNSISESAAYIPTLQWAR